MTAASAELCRHFGLERPIFQAGMGWLTTGSLAAAVSAAGGLGVIATGGYMSPVELRAHIARVRDEAPRRPFGVNVLFPGGAPEQDVFANADLTGRQLDVCLEEQVPVVLGGLGDPRSIIPRLHASGVKFVAIVGSTRAAQRTAEAGADAVVVQGNEAGGHVGPTGTLSLAQSALRAVGCPMLVAGGIATAEAARSALALGAAGVSVGTRFIAAEESDAHPAYKAAVAGAGENATLVTRACTGKPSRALRNAFVERWIGREGEIQPYPAQAVEHFWRSRAGCLEGELDEGFLPLGQCASVVDEILPAAAIVEMLGAAELPA